MGFTNHYNNCPLHLLRPFTKLVVQASSSPMANVIGKDYDWWKACQAACLQNWVSYISFHASMIGTENPRYKNSLAAWAYMCTFRCLFKPSPPFYNCWIADMPYIRWNHWTAEELEFSQHDWALSLLLGKPARLATSIASTNSYKMKLLLTTFFEITVYWCLLTSPPTKAQGI